MKLKRRLTLIIATATLAGCGLYLHRPELETTTAALKSDFGKLSGPDYLKAQQQNIESLATREDRAVAEFMIASRDYSLLNITQPPGGEDQRPSHQRFQEAIATLMREAVGVDRLGADDARNIETFPSRQLARQDDLQIIERRFRGRLRRYRDQGGTSTALTCERVLAAEAPAADSARARTIYGQMRGVCQERVAARALVDTCLPIEVAGRLGETCDRANMLREERLAENRRPALVNAVAALRKAAAASRGPGATERFDEIARQAEEFPTLAGYRAVLGSIETIFGEDLGALLNEAAAQPGQVFDRPAAQMLRDALGLIDAIDDVHASATASPLDQPNALLIGLSKVRHDLNLLDLEIERRDRLSALELTKATALRVQVHYLARAQSRLDDARCVGGRCQSPAAYAEALSLYMNAFDAGLIPFEILNARQSFIEWRYGLRHAQITEADYRALLAPAIEQLAAYGAGGIRPNILAPFLANLPVTGAIIGG